MFARLCVILSVVLSADFTLPNGIRIADLPSSDSSRFEIIVGYQAGVRNENGGMSGLASAISHSFAASASTRALSLAAYGAGGDLQFENELDRTALRVSVPAWAKPMILDHVVALLNEKPPDDGEWFDRMRSAQHPSTFRSKIEDEIRIGLLGSHPYHHPIEGWPADAKEMSADDAVRFFNENYGTDRAFVLMSSPATDDFREKLSAIPERKSRKITEAAIRVSNAERILHFPSEESPGAMIFASPVPGVFYRGWYAVLMLDRLIRRSIPGKPSTTIIPTMDPYYWRLEVAVPPGQFAETAQDNVLQDINRLQFARAKPDDLEAARREALEYLSAPYALEWFASQGIESRRQDGVAWIRSFTADDMRSTARDLLLLNRVIASWSPKAKQNVAQVENLAPITDGAKPASKLKTLSPVNASAFPQHTDSVQPFPTPEHLASGVWLVDGSESMIFLNGSEKSGLPEGNRRDGPNGSIWTAIATTDESTVRAFQKYRGDRILILCPPAMRDRTRSAWLNFKGNERDPLINDPIGKVANIDIPALIILKAMLDRKLIESGWWHEAALSIDASQGATLRIEAKPEIQDQITDWIKAIGNGSVPESDILWAREVAIHHLKDVLPNVQMILWQRVPEYILADLSTIAATQVRDVAKLFF